MPKKKIHVTPKNRQRARKPAPEPPPTAPIEFKPIPEEAPVEASAEEKPRWWNRLLAS